MWEYGVLHFSLLFTFVYTFGCMYGLVLLALFVIVADYVMDKMGYVRLSFIDMLMWFEEGGCNHNLIGFFEIEKIKFEEFEQMLFERGIMNIKTQNWNNCHNILFNYFIYSKICNIFLKILLFLYLLYYIGDLFYLYKIIWIQYLFLYLIDVKENKFFKI